MRRNFDEQLELLNQQLIEMGALCEAAISKAAKALIDHDDSLAREVIRIDVEIDQKEKDIESMCFRLLLHQHPVARDLRQISSALKMITDMERIGDQAADISEIILLGNVHTLDNAVHIGEMANATIKMVTDSIDAYVRGDLELARSVIDYDDVVDDLFNQVKKEIIDIIGNDKKNGEYAVDLLMIAKYFERIGDHATNIAEWVEYAITGIHKGGERI